MVIWIFGISHRPHHDWDRPQTLSWLELVIDLIMIGLIMLESAINFIMIGNSHKLHQMIGISHRLHHD